MNFKKSSPILFLFCLMLSFSSYGQFRHYGQSTIISNVDFNLGYYMPGLDYLKNDSYIAGINGKFNGGVMATAGGEIKLNTFYFGAFTGFWRDKMEVNNILTGGINRDEKLSISLIPITFKLKYEFLVGSTRNWRTQNLIYFHPYVGFGTTYNLISQRFKRTLDGVATKENLFGTTVSYMGIVGVKYTLRRHLDIGIEYNHALGDFNQAFIVGGESEVHAISLDGPAATISLSYTFYNRVVTRVHRINRSMR